MLLLVFFSVSGCEQPQAESVIGVGLAAYPENLHPLYATDAASVRIARSIYQPLVDFDASDRPQPVLADWEHPEPRLYRLKLRSGLAPFSDGQALTAADIEATYAFVLDRANASPLRGALEVISSVNAMDERTVEFRLTRPDPHFPAYLGLGIVPASALKNTDHRTPPPGNGPFVYEGGDGRTRLSLRRVGDGQLFELSAVRDPVVRVLKLMRGEIHLLQNDLPPELFDYLSEQDGIAVESLPGSNFSYLGFNLDDPVTSDIRVRRAIAHAIDLDAIGHHLFHDRLEPAQSLFTPRHWLGTDLSPVAHDPALARALLAEVGYGPDNPLKLVYKTSSDAFRLRLASVLQAQLRPVGIDLELRSYDWGTFFGDIKKGNFQLYGMTWVGMKTPDSFRYIFHSGSVPPAGANRGRYRSDDADGLIEQAETMDDPLQQIPVYQELQRVLLAELPYVPLWYEHHVAATRSEVHGYRLVPDGNYDGLVNTTWSR